MRLNSERLKTCAAAAGIDDIQLVEAVSRPGLEGDKAHKAVRNWLMGKHTPKCRPSDISRLAQACGVQPKDIARFVSEVRHHRGSTQKARLVADVIRGKSFEEAERALRFMTKRAAVNVQKALMAAQADAQQFGADPELLVVAESRVDEGQQIKRFRPKDRGRAHSIIKQTSHITVGLEERVGRKA